MCWITRTLSEEAAYGESGNPAWQNLRLLIVHSTEVYIPLDINKSPFNVGLAIELNQLLAFKLHSMGLVVLQGNQVSSSCELYQRYFGDRF